MTRTPLSRSKGQRSRSPGRFAHRRVGASGGCSGGRENVLAVGNCCYVAVCSAAEVASAPTGRGEGRGHTVAATRLQLVIIVVIAHQHKASGVKTKQSVKQRLQRLLIRCSLCRGRRPHSPPKGYGQALNLKQQNCFSGILRMLSTIYFITVVLQTTA